MLPLLYDSDLLNKIDASCLPGFYTTEDYPFLQEIEKEFCIIKDEYWKYVQNNNTGFQSWPQAQMTNYNIDSWQVLPVYFRTDAYGQKDKLKIYLEDFPNTFNLLKKVLKDNLCDVSFSRLAPKSFLRPHNGKFMNYLRCHIGVDIPTGDCGIKVNGSSAVWQEGKILVFNEALEHEAWNNTDHYRTVLIFDFIPQDYKKFFPE